MVNTSFAGTPVSRHQYPSQLNKQSKAYGKISYNQRI